MVKHHLAKSYGSCILHTSENKFLYPLQENGKMTKYLQGTQMPLVKMEQTEFNIIWGSKGIYWIFQPFYIFGVAKSQPHETRK